MCDDDEVSVNATEKEALKLRFYTLFVDMFFIVMSDLKVKKNELTIAVLKPENVIDDEILTIHIEAVVIEDDFAAAV